MNRFVWRATAVGCMVLFFGCSGVSLPWRKDPPTPSPESADPTTKPFTKWKNGPDHLDLARNLVAQGHYTVAIRQLTDTLKGEEDSPEPYYLLGVCHRETKAYDMAQSCFNHAIDLDAEFAPAHSGLGITYFLIKAFGPAEKSMRQAIKLDPANASYQNNLGVMLLRQNRLEEAQPFFEMGLKLDPNNKRAANNLAECLLRLGRDNEAFAVLQRLFTLSVAYTNLGNFYLNQGRPDQARDMFSQALILDPSLAIARQNLEWLSKGENNKQ